MASIVPGPDPQVRQVDLWVIPGDLVGAIDINKTLSANEDGDAIGGSVNLHMRQATSSRPTLDLESLGGYNPIDTGQPWFRDDATVGKRFGPQQRFGVMFSLQLRPERPGHRRRGAGAGRQSDGY